jgi:hypothetical protein
MTKYFLTILLVAAVLVYGISRMAGLGFEALWSAIGFTEREERRVKALNELLGAPGEGAIPSGAVPSASRPVIFSEVEAQVVPARSYDLKIGMSLSEMYLGLGRPLRCRDEGRYSYFTYEKINVVVKDRQIVGWAQRQ